jgi:hypothetical protein
MCRAVRFVKSGDTGYLTGSKYCSVPRGTLEKLVNVHLGIKTVLPSEPENKLVKYCIITDQSYYELTD